MFYLQFRYLLVVFCFLNKTLLLHCKLPYLKCEIFTQFITQLKQILAYISMGIIFTASRMAYDHNQILEIISVLVLLITAW